MFGALTLALTGALTVPLVGVGCSADVEPMSEIGELVASGPLDFGVVEVGLTATSSLTVRNTGDTAIRVVSIDITTNPTTDAYRFTVPRDGFLVPAQGSVRLPVSFAPHTTTLDPEGYAITVVLVTDVYDAEPPYQQRTVQVVLRGRPVPPGIDVSPNPVDFGEVLAGTEKTIAVILRNKVDVPIRMWSGAPTDPVASDEGRIRWLPDDPATFSLSITPAVDGRLNTDPIAPGESLVLQATYRPDADSAGAVHRAGWYVRNCDDPLCRVLVAFEGRSSDDLLRCEPAAVAFGRVNPGRVGLREVVCTNPISDVVTLDQVTLTGATAFRVDVVGGAPQPVAPGESVTLRVSYGPSPTSLGTTESAALTVIASDGNGGRQERALPVSGQAGGPRVEVSPNPLDFGLVAVGVPLTRGLVVTNAGFEPLTVTSIQLDGARPEAFFVDRTGFTLAPGEVRLLDVTFDPQTEGQLGATLLVFSDDDQAPETAVALTGAAERVLPCEYALSPESIDFGIVFIGTQVVRTVRLRNTGPDACIVNGIEIEADDPSAFSLLDDLGGGVRVAPGTDLALRLRYAPTSPGTDRGLAVARVSDPGEPVAGIPLVGRAERPVNAGCPPAQTTPSGTPVQLTAGATDGVRYEWALISAPNGGGNTPDLWTPDPPRGRSVQFLPFIVGLYEIELAVQTAGGQTVSCRTQVTAEGQGLRVTLTWDGPGDVDLHVHNGDPGTAWFDDTDDCHYSNPQPIWVAGVPAAIGSNPELDFDNTSADGPENTSIDQPEINRVYHVGVHHYARAAGRRALVEIFCGGTSVPDASFRSRPLTGRSAGRCDNPNDFWRVATVRFLNSGQCVIQAIDTYDTTIQACSQL